MSHRYEVWIGEGQALLGEFFPRVTLSDRAYIRLTIGPPDYPTNKVLFFFKSEADMVTTAKTLRQIAEAIERTLYPELEPDWGDMPGAIEVHGGRWTG